MTVTTATLDNGMRQVRDTILIRRPPQELYDLWRGLTRLPEIMEHVISVTGTGQGRSHWIVKGPAGRTVEWDAEMTEKPAERTIAWHTLPGAVFFVGGVPKTQAGGLTPAGARGG